MVPSTSSPTSSGKPAHPLGRILIIEDEAPMARILRKSLQTAGYDVEAFTDPRAGLEALKQPPATDVLLSDMKMPHIDGMSVLEQARTQDPDMPVIIITAYGTIEGAVSAMQAGAFDYITKPFQQGHLLAQIERALEHRHVLQENERLSELFTQQTGQPPMIGRSPAIERVRRMVERTGPTESSVLITGPSGCGKELVARALHQHSGRRGGRFVPINCPSIAPTLIESEMFGYERGAFTGADRSKMGLVELAHQGTLFLDEVAELPSQMQVKLLRLIQEREIQRVGGLRQIPVNLRLIAATNRDLELEMARGTFREDLFYRLNVIRIQIPRLAERIEDIPLIAEHYLEQLGRRFDKPELCLTPEAIDLLQRHSWPGNVRELQNVLERTAILCDHSRIDRDDLPSEWLYEQNQAAKRAATDPAAAPGAGNAWPLDYRQAREHFERSYLHRLLYNVEGNVSQAARISGISRRNLYEKLNKVGLVPDSFQDHPEPTDPT